MSNLAVFGIISGGSQFVVDDQLSVATGTNFEPLTVAQNTNGYVIYGLTARLRVEFHDANGKIDEIGVISTNYFANIALPMLIPPGYTVRLVGDAQCVYKVL